MKAMHPWTLMACMRKMQKAKTRNLSPRRLMGCLCAADVSPLQSTGSLTANLTLSLRQAMTSQRGPPRGTLMKRTHLAQPQGDLAQDLTLWFPAGVKRTWVTGAA